MTGNPRAPRSLLYGLAAVVATFVARGLFYSDFVPLWDGRLYADCVTSAAAHGLEFSQLNCFDHASIAYIGVLALPQLLAPGSYPLLLLTNLLLGAMALVYFFRTARVLYPGDEQRLICLLATAAFSVHPVLLASAVNTNVDYGVLVFYIPVLYYTLRAQWVRAMLFGVALVFSKESGVVLMGILGAAYLATHVLPEDGLRAKWLKLRPTLWALIPPTLLAIHFLNKPRPRTGSALWKGVSPAALLGLLSPVVTDPSILLNYLIGIFVLSFQWIPTLVIAAAGALWLRARFAGETRLREEHRAQTLIALTFAASTYVLTRFPTFLNVRYFLPLAPLLLLLAQQAATTLARRSVQVAGWSLLSVVLLVSNYYTVDPVSSRLFGTFLMQEHRLLKMTSLSQECCGFGRDQLVYNMQFTQFHYLQNQIYEDLQPTEKNFLTGTIYPDFYFAGPLDPLTFHRSLRDGPGSIHNRWLSNLDLLTAAELPQSAYYIALPNLPSQDSFIERLYSVVARKAYSRRGYGVEVFELALRPDARAILRQVTR